MTEEYPILAAASQIRAQLGSELVNVPEWRSRVWVYELTGRELDEYRQGMFKSKSGGVEVSLKNATLRLLVLALRDGNGNRLYPNTERGILELGDLPAGGSERLAKVARLLSGLTDAEDSDEDADEDDSEAGDGGNSAGSAAWPGGGRVIDASTSASPVTSVALSASS